MDAPTKNSKLTDLLPEGLTPEEKQAVVDEFLASFDYKRGYRDSIDYLDYNFAFFLTHVLNMGKPELDPGIPTAAVLLPSKKARRDDFKYIFNPTLFAMLDTEERAFVMAHETMHVLLNHLMLLRKGQEQGKFKDMRRFNIAADCVINDYLVGMGLEPGRMANYGVFGPQTVGYNCANATVTQVYDDVPEPQDDDQQQDGDGGSSGDPLDDFMKQAAAAQSNPGFDDHSWLEAKDTDAEAEAEKLGQDAKDNAQGSTPQDLEDKKSSDAGNPPPSIVHGIGTGEDQRMQRWQEEKGVSMKWAELLREIDPDMFKKGGPPPRPSYHSPRRKLVGINRDLRAAGQRPVILPVIRKDDRRKDGEIPSIFMALDASGSCAHHINTFITLAKSVPANKIKLWCVTFTTVVRDLDLDNPTYHSGGTAFGPIEEYVRTRVVPELGHYPKAVVVVTDGDGHFSPKPAEEHKARWTWLLTDNGEWATADAKSVGRCLQYNDFAQGVKGASI
jgi:hypothetical protein